MWEQVPEYTLSSAEEPHTFFGPLPDTWNSFLENVYSRLAVKLRMLRSETSQEGPPNTLSHSAGLTVPPISARGMTYPGTVRHPIGTFEK